MTRSPLFVVALAATGLWTAACSPAASTIARKPQAVVPTVETLFSLPGGFLENLTVRPDGGIVFTSYLDKTVRLRDATGTVTVLATLPAHPVGIVTLDEGYLISAHGASFTDGPAFTTTNQILLLGADGQIIRTVAAPDARFLNGVLGIAADRVLIADSIAGTIWSLVPSTGALSPWLVDDGLFPDPATQPFRPGANGIKVRGGRVYVSNPSRGTIQSIGLTADGAPGGRLTPFASPGPVDDFVFGPDDTLYGATHGQTLVAIAPDGTSRTVMSEGCDSCTSVALTGQGADARLIVLTTGDRVEGGTKPARMLSVPLP